MQPDIACFTGLIFFEKVVSSLHLIIDHLHIDHVRGEAFPGTTAAIQTKSASWPVAVDLCCLSHVSAMLQQNNDP